jgi:dTMP kinase
LVEALRERGNSVTSIREPGATPLGERVRELLLGAAGEVEARAEVFLFLAARAQLVPKITRRLSEGEIVVADRFFLSTYAYQVAGRGLSEPLVQSANALAVGDLVPDLTLVLLHSADAGLARKRAAGGDPDRIERAGVDFHRRVAEAFAVTTTESWQRAHPECGPIVGLDASGSASAVAERVWETIARRFPELGGKQ